MTKKKDPTSIKTLGALKKSGYQSKPIKTELRDNLMAKLRSGGQLFEGILGFDQTVIPDLQKALLSRHNIILLGLRGQAKTRIARLMTSLMDEYIPIVEGTELNDDPFQPISRQARDIIDEKGDSTPIAWMHRDERYTEKLATPDVTTADLIGDVDPIKAATLKLPYSDERVIHYGLVPHAHRGLFVINELPDLQPRIQVALFNILQEGDVQIRGFKLRLPLDILFVFTANPEDYTNRGTIITPLKDRIESQILTHYPRTMDISRTITEQEARLEEAQHRSIKVPRLIKDLVEQVAIEARQSEYVDQKSGVSARLTISAYELLHSAVERRMLLNNDKKATARVTDIWGIMPAITGKVELVYEGEQEGPEFVANKLIGNAIKSQFLQLFPNPEDLKNKRQQEDDESGGNNNAYREILDWFANGKNVDLMREAKDENYKTALDKVKGLQAVVKKYANPKTDEEDNLLRELVLYGLSEFGQINRDLLEEKATFKDFLSDMFDDEDLRNLRG